MSWADVNRNCNTFFLSTSLKMHFMKRGEAQGPVIIYGQRGPGGKSGSVRALFVTDLIDCTLQEWASKNYRAMSNGPLCPPPPVINNDRSLTMYQKAVIMFYLCAKSMDWNNKTVKIYLISILISGGSIRLRRGGALS